MSLFLFIFSFIDTVWFIYAKISMCGKICGTPEKTAAAILHPYLPQTVKQNIFVLSVMDWI